MAESQRPINPGDISIDRRKLAMTAPAQTVEQPSGPGPGSLNIPRTAFTAYIPPPPTKETAPVSEDRVQVRMLPIGGCVHPLDYRWAAEALDIEGCTYCGLSQQFKPGEGLSWTPNEAWQVAARQAGVLRA